MARAGGRPRIGPSLKVILPDRDAAQVDDIARAENRTRAQVLRDIIALGLVAYRRRQTRTRKDPE